MWKEESELRLDTRNIKLGKYKRRYIPRGARRVRSFLHVDCKNFWPL